MKNATLAIPHNDQKYIEALIKGDEQIITEIYKKYAPDCKRFVLKNSGTVGDATDVFQETLIAVLSKAKAKPIELTVPFGAYLYRVYKNKWIDELRKKSKNPLTIIEHDRYVDEAPTDKEKQYSIYKECFEAFGKECKELMSARFSGMRGNDIAVALGITRNNVNQKMLVCRNQLKSCCQSHPEFSNL